MSAANRIDVHSHCEPDFYHEYMYEYGVKDAGGTPWPKWSVEEHLAMMDRNGIAKSIVSLSMPGVHMGDDQKAREMARRINEYTADLKAKYPERFGFFATLTLPDVEGAMNEMNYALHHLDADGIVLMTNVGNRYVGEVSNKPLFDELNKRKAIVFLHPNNLIDGAAAPTIPPFVADFLLNTVRAAITLVQSGTMSSCTDIKFILSHAGGFLPYIATRASAIGGSPEGMARVMADFKRFYLDTAISSSPTVFPSLMTFTDSKHVLYGSDWPFVPAAMVETLTGFYDGYPGLSEEQKEDINNKNATLMGL